MTPSPQDLWCSFFPYADEQFNDAVVGATKAFVDEFDFGSHTHFPLADCVMASLIGGGPIDRDLYASNGSTT